MEREAPVARVAICDPSEISTVAIAHSLSRQGMDVAGIALETVAAAAHRLDEAKHAVA